MLQDKKCIPCRGDLPPMSIEEIEPLLTQVPGWNLVGSERGSGLAGPNERGVGGWGPRPPKADGAAITPLREPMRLQREFKFKNFREALRFVNRVGEIAEAEGHHPNILIHDWNRVSLELYTHKIKGLHENDFILAAKIELGIT